MTPNPSYARPEPTVSPAARPDILVLGGGVIGLAAALECAERRLRCRVLTRNAQGVATPASAGLLAPSVEHTPAAAGPFLRRGLDVYPDFLGRLADLSGVAVRLQRGLLEVLLPGDDGELPASRKRLTGAALEAVEPRLAPATVAVFHPQDGSVDSRQLWDALRGAAERHPLVEVIPRAAVRLEAGPNSVRVVADDGRAHEAGSVLLAAGAWSASIAGLPRALPVEPVRGQMISLGATPLTYSVMAPAGYLVPRGDVTLAGSTMEWTGWNAGTTPEGLAGLARMAAAISPALRGAPVSQGWAGLRPVTPDLLPIIGRDPDAPNLVYACGHSRNGILLAAITAQCIGALMVGETPPGDLRPFAVGRF